MSEFIVIHLKHETRMGYDEGWIATSRPADTDLFKNKQVMFTTLPKPTILDSVQHIVSQIRYTVNEGDKRKLNFKLDAPALELLSPEEAEAVDVFLSE